MQHKETVKKLERIGGICLTGSFLRIEYCQDVDGFWLEPHRDLGVKLLTIQTYLSIGAESKKWGTDLLDANLRVVSTTSFTFNCGLMFVPGENTWHGFRKRPIKGVRRSMIVNYVSKEWRNTHQLAFPGQPVG